MPPAPRAPHEQLEHLYNFSNTPRTLAAGKRLQEVSGVMNPCSMSLDKNMARSWQRESCKHGAHSGCVGPARNEHLDPFEMPTLKNGRPATPLTNTVLVAPGLMVPELLNQTPVEQRIVNDTIDFHCCTLDTIGRNEWDEEWGDDGGAAKSVRPQSSAGSVLDDGEIRGLLDELVSEEQDEAEEQDVAESILDDPDLQELLVATRTQTKGSAATAVRALRVASPVRKPRRGDPQDTGISEAEMRVATARVLAASRSASTSSAAAAAAAVPELQTSFLVSRSGALASARGAAPRKIESRAEGNMSNTAEVESFMALVSARRSDLDSGRDFRPTTPPTPHTPGSLVRGRPGSALSARPGSAALGSVSTRAAKFRKDQFQSSNGARTQAAAEEMVRQNRLRELRAPSPRPVTPQLNKSPIKSHGKIADRSALTRAMLETRCRRQNGASSSTS